MSSLRDLAHNMVVYIYFITSAGNSISSQLGSSCKGHRYGTEKAGGTARPSRTKSHLSSHSPPASQAAAALGQPSSLRLQYCGWCVFVGGGGGGWIQFQRKQKRVVFVPCWDHRVPTPHFLYGRKKSFERGNYSPPPTSDTAKPYQI